MKEESHISEIGKSRLHFDPAMMTRWGEGLRSEAVYQHTGDRGPFFIPWSRYDMIDINQ